MTFSLIFENRDVVTQKDIYGGNFGTVGRWIGVVPGTMLGYAIGNQFDHGGYGAALGSGIGAAIGGQIGKYTGRFVAPNPDAPISYNKPLHRTGYLGMVSTSPHGFMVDVVSHNPLVTSIGSNLYNAVSDDGVKKLGYDNNAVRMAEVGAGPFLGLIPPKKLTKMIGVFAPDKIS